MLFFVLIHFIWALLQGLRFIYIFQIKEYRFDRLQSIAKEIGYLRFLYTTSLKIPKVSLRNILLVFFLTLGVSALFLYSFEQKYLFEFLGYSFFLAPLASFGIVSCGVFLTNIPSTILRSRIRYRAIQKVKKTKAVFIGITGSYGKTSIKEYLAQILSIRFNVVKTPKNMNTDVGIALSINRLLTKSTEFFITELGAYRSGELNYAASYIPFQYIILSGLGNQHLDLYGSKKALIQEEMSPVLHLPDSGTAYLNYESITENAIDVSKFNTVTFGTSPHADIHLTDVKVTPEGTIGIMHYKNRLFKINTRLLGTHSLENLLPAVAISFDLGLNPRVIEKQISKMQPLIGKLSKHKGRNNATILHDGVNSNFNGFLAAIDVMKLFPQSKKIIMTQGIIELGVEKRSTYEQILHKMNNSGIKLFTTDIVFTTIKNNITIFTFNDVESIQKNILQSLDSNTLLLIEGAFAQPIIDTFIIHLDHQNRSRK